MKTNNENTIKRQPRRLESLPKWTVSKKVDSNNLWYIIDANGNRWGSNWIIDDIYEVIDFIGEGGTSLCYRALNKKTGRIYVVKEFYPLEFDKQLTRDNNGIIIPIGEQTQEFNDAYEEAFQQEKENKSNLQYVINEDGVNNDSRLLLPQRDIHVDSYNKYLLIDTVAGKFLDSFKAFENSNDIDMLKKIIVIMINILIALEALHKKHYLHLDLKPENILIESIDSFDENIGGNNRALFIDFGSAFKLDSSNNVITRKNFSSTGSFAAPELKSIPFYTKKEREKKIESISFSTDLYSVMKIFLWLLGCDINDLESTTEQKIKKSKVVKTLSPPLQKMLIRLANKILCSVNMRKIRTATKLKEEFEQLLDAIEKSGIHTAIITQESYDNASNEKAIIEDAFLGDIEVITAEE